VGGVIEEGGTPAACALAERQDAAALHAKHARIEEDEAAVMREIERAKSMHDVVDEVLPKVTHACTAAHIHTRTTHAHTLPNSTLNIALGLQLWTTHTHTLTYMHTLTMTRRRNNAQARVIEITVGTDTEESFHLSTRQLGKLSSWCWARPIVQFDF